MACVLAERKKSRAAAFPDGDLPEAPGGKKAALSRFAMARSNYFPPPPEGGRLCIAKQNSWPAPSSALLRPYGCKTVSASGKGIAVKAAMSAADPPARKAPAMSRDESTFPFPDTEPHTASATAHLLDELQLHGHRAGQDEPDPRPLPEPDAVRGQLDASLEALSVMLTATRLEDDLGDLLWSFVNMFHRKIDRVERQLDTNEQAQRRGQAEQDGSEVKSVELERLINQGLCLIERRNAFEFVRDYAAELYDVTTGSASWLTMRKRWPRSAGREPNERG